MANELQQTISYHINKYKKSFDRKLGLVEDDLINDIREQVWKGLLTWKSDGKANRKTYLNSLIKKRFLTLLKKSSIEKYNSIDYYADAFSPNQGSIDKDRLETHETGELLYLRRQELMRDIESLEDATDQKIYADLLQGFSIEEMSRRNFAKTEMFYGPGWVFYSGEPLTTPVYMHQYEANMLAGTVPSSDIKLSLQADALRPLTRLEVIAAINRIDARLAERHENTSRGVL